MQQLKSAEIYDFYEQAPEQPEPWIGVLDGTQDAPACLFVGSFPGDPDPANGQSEDCLYINVYSSSPVPDGVS